MISLSEFFKLEFETFLQLRFSLKFSDFCFSQIAMISAVHISFLLNNSHHSNSSLRVLKSLFLFFVLEKQFLTLIGNNAKQMQIGFNTY